MEERRQKKEKLAQKQQSNLTLKDMLANADISK
jgi:hypothetical protein